MVEDLYENIKRQSLSERRASEMYKKLSITILDDHINQLRN